MLNTDETYNNKQVSKDFRQNFSWLTCLKMDYFGGKSQKSPSAEGSVPRPPFRFNN